MLKLDSNQRTWAMVSIATGCFFIPLILEELYKKAQFSDMQNVIFTSILSIITCFAGYLWIRLLIKNDHAKEAFYLE